MEAVARRSIIFSDVTVGFVEQVLVGVQFVFEQGATQRLLHLAPALGCIFPAVDSNLFHEVVKFCGDALNDNVRDLGLGFFEQFDQLFLGAGALLDRIGLLLGFQGGVVVDQCPRTHSSTQQTPEIAVMEGHAKFSGFVCRTEGLFV